jgi:hypothetical protein
MSISRKTTHLQNNKKILGGVLSFASGSSKYNTVQRELGHGSDRISGRLALWGCVSGCKTTTQVAVPDWSIKDEPIIEKSADAHTPFRAFERFRSRVASERMIMKLSSWPWGQHHKFDDPTKNMETRTGVPRGNGSSGKMFLPAVLVLKS